LWPETVDALKSTPKKGKLVFYTRHNKPMISERYNEINNSEKYSSSNMVTIGFLRLIKKAGINIPKGTGFCSLRRTAATVAAKSGDPFAVQRLLGHTDLKMATRYVQDISEQTDRVIDKSRNYLLFNNS